MYDVSVVGARCAGAPTAMLLARQGHRVLLVDKAIFNQGKGADVTDDGDTGDGEPGCSLG